MRGTRRLSTTVGWRLEVEGRRGWRAAGRRTTSGRHRLKRRPDGRRMVQTQVIRMKPTQPGSRGRGQSAGGHLKRVATRSCSGATAGRGTLQVGLCEQRSRVVSGQGQLSVEQEVGGGTERGRTQGPAQARAARVHAGVQIRQQVWRRRDWRPERHVW